MWRAESSAHRSWAIRSSKQQLRKSDKALHAKPEAVVDTRCGKRSPHRNRSRLPRRRKWLDPERRVDHQRDTAPSFAAQCKPERDSDDASVMNSHRDCSYDPDRSRHVAGRHRQSERHKRPPQRTAWQPPTSRHNGAESRCDGRVWPDHIAWLP